MARKPSTIIFKFKITSSSISPQTLFEAKNKFSVVVETGSLSQYGRVKFLLSGSSGILSASTGQVPIFNQRFWNLLLQRSVVTESVNVNQTYTVKINSVNFDRITYYASASLIITGSLTSSYNASYNDDEQFFVGGTTGSIFSSSRFYGEVSDLKFYDSIIRHDIYEQQCYSEKVVISNNTTASFTDLLAHYQFSDNIDLSTTSSIYDSSYYKLNHATASGFTENKFNSIYQTNIYKPRTTGYSGRPTTSKIRIINNIVTQSDGYSVLSPNDSIESHSVDIYGKDSDKVDFLFSPANIENKKILKFFNPEIGNYIADPKYMFNYTGGYTDLDNLYKYFRLYNTPVDLQTYINNAYRLSKNLFKNIQQFNAERVRLNAGISIEPNILERTYVNYQKSSSIQNLTKQGTVQESLLPVLSSSYSSLIGITSKIFATQSQAYYNTYNSNIVATTQSVFSTYTNYSASIPQQIVDPISNYTNYSASILQQIVDPISNYLLYSSLITVNTARAVSDYKEYRMTIPGRKITESAVKDSSKTTTLIARDDRLILQGVKQQVSVEGYQDANNELKFRTVLSSSSDTTTYTIINPYNDIKLTPVYNTSSGVFEYRPNDNMIPNSDGTYSSKHIKFSRYTSKYLFSGTETRGPEHPSGSTTLDGGQVILVSFTSPNIITVTSADSETSRLKVDGIDLNI